MVGWGLTGVIGAGLALATRGRIGRVPLALVCFAVGFAFTVLQDFGDWVTYSDHSSAQLIVYVGKGLGFDLVHAVGCLALRARLRPVDDAGDHPLPGRGSRSAGGSRLTVVPVTRAACDHRRRNPRRSARGRRTGQRRAAARWPLAYLLSAENADGGFGEARATPSNPLFSGWAALALAAAGSRPGARRGRACDGARLPAQHPVERQGPGRPGADDPRRPRGRREPLRFRRPRPRHVARTRHRPGRRGRRADEPDGVCGARTPRCRETTTTADDRAGSCASRTPTAASTSRPRPGTSDVDDTGAVLEAIAAAAPRRTVGRAVAFIRAAQNGDGGFPSQPGATSNAQSTAFGIEGLIAAGVDPGNLHRAGARSPIAYLESLIAPDGHVRYALGEQPDPRVGNRAGAARARATAFAAAARVGPRPTEAPRQARQRPVRP